LWEPYIQNLTRAGANYIRVWLTDSWDDLYFETGLGTYSMANADNIDEVLAIALANGVKVLMCIESFNLFCDRENAPCNWGSCVYNAANGGMLAEPGDFWTDTAAASYFRMRLQYLVARYGSYSSVFAWEFFNEGDIAAGFAPALQQSWVNAMATFVKSIDPYAHPISTSFCCHDVSEVYSSTAVDFSMTHTYGTHNRLDMADNNQYWSARMASEYSKPTYIAEFGTGAGGPPGATDTTGISLHNGMWSSVVSAAAMASMSWWWDNWIRPYHLYHHFTAVSKFTLAVDWHAYRWTPFAQPAPPPNPNCTDVPPAASGANYTCAQQKSWGKCNATSDPWMIGYCCKTCWGCAAGCGGPPPHAPAIVAPFVRMLASTGSALHNGASDAAASTARGRDPPPAAVIVLWLQNVNSTWAKQNSSAPPASRWPLLPVAGIEVDLAAGRPPHGRFDVVWYDTASGATTAGTPVMCGLVAPSLVTELRVGTNHGAAGTHKPRTGAEGRSCILRDIPTFTADIACILTLVE
jgi:hypothetical protein